jgi:hypothetical protein
LIVQTCEHIIAKRQAAYRENLTVLDDGARAGMKVAYRDPETWFLVEIWIASKSEAELRERIGDVLARVNDPVDVDIQAAVKELELYSIDFTTMKYLLRSLVRGMAIEFSSKPDGALFDRVVDLAFDALRVFAKDRRK